MESYEIELISTKADVRAMSTDQLKAELAVYLKYKMWTSRFYSVRREVDSRSTRRWVNEDVFGHTFTGSAE